jgi:hypothetical protein
MPDDGVRYERDEDQCSVGANPNIGRIACPPRDQEVEDDASGTSGHDASAEVVELRPLESTGSAPLDREEAERDCPNGNEVDNVKGIQRPGASTESIGG